MIITEDKVPAVDRIYYWVGENGEYDFIYTKLNEQIRLFFVLLSNCVLLWSR